MQGQDLKKQISTVLKYTAKNYTTSREFFDHYKYFFCDLPLPPFRNDSSPRYATIKDFEQSLANIKRSLRDVDTEDWTESTIKELLLLTAKRFEGFANLDVDKKSDHEDAKQAHQALLWYLRLGIARGGSGPAMQTTMVILGKEVCLQRLEELLDSLRGESK